MRRCQSSGGLEPLKVTEGKITRRMHCRDSQHPDRFVNTPSLLNKYQNWGSLSSASFVRETGSKSAKVPIGRTLAPRSFQSQTEIDGTNVYQGTKTPGPGAYETQAHLNFGSTLPKPSMRIGIGTMGSSHRACMMKYGASHKFPERITLSPRPGPGEYDANRPGSATLKGGKNIRSLGEKQKIRLYQVNNQIRRAKEKIKSYDTLTDEKRQILSEEARNEIKRLQVERKALKKGLQKLGASEITQGYHHDIAFPSVSESLRGTAAFTDSISDRFFHPLNNSNSFLFAPGPGAHEIHPNESLFGHKNQHKATTLGWGFRSTDKDCPKKYQLPNMRLTEKGDVYFTDPAENLGPSDYIPVLLPENSSS